MGNDDYGIQNHYAETPSSDSPIGVFDSGVGGVSVLRAIRQALPDEKLLYLADSAFAPYGDREPDYIIDRCLTINEFFRAQPVKAIVVACNTASALAIADMRARSDIPIVGIEPAIKPAAMQTKTGVVGVLATSRTVRSDGVKRLCDQHAHNVRVLLQACPGLVEKIERNKLQHNDTNTLLRRYLEPLLDAGADTIVLGCTHYPFLRENIAAIAGDEVRLIEPGAAVARQLVKRLTDTGVLNRRADSTHPGSTRAGSATANVVSPDVIHSDSPNTTFYTTTRSPVETSHSFDKAGQSGTIAKSAHAELEPVSLILSALWGESVSVKALRQSRSGLCHV